MEIIVNLCGQGSLWGGMSILRSEAVVQHVDLARGKNQNENEDMTMIFQVSGKCCSEMMLAFVMLAGCKSKAGCGDR